MSGKGMGGHQKPVMGKDEWLTPPHIIKALGTFDLDPCSPGQRRPWDTAKKHYGKPDDGLTLPWFGRVWLNPPYGREASAWLARLADHGRGTALIFARTETEMFFKFVWGRASAVLFLEGRLHFHHVDGSRAEANAGAPSVLVCYGAEDAEKLKNSGIKGKFLRLAGDLF